MITAEALGQLVRDLGDAVGFELKLVEESVSADGDFLSVTARSPRRSEAARSVNLEALAKLQISPDDAGGTETWALVFFFVNGQRVAPPGLCHLTLEHERGDGEAARWVAQGWEADVYEEWTGLERLEGDDAT